MALVSRILVVIFAFIVASFTAAMVITLAIAVSEWGSMVTMSPYGAWVSVAFFGFTFSGLGLLPAFLVILLAESFRIRSVFFYTIVSGVGFAVLYYGIGFGTASGTLPGGNRLEIMAAAGIAAGFVYWAIAGRNAGKWQRDNNRPSDAEIPPPAAPNP
jgi:hypothetical protein